MSRAALAAAWADLGGDPDRCGIVTFTGPERTLPSVYEVTELGAASIAAATLAVAELVDAPSVEVDRRHAALAFACEREVRARGWELPPVWDPIAGDYAAADGWIRLHTNYAHHRAAVVKALGVAADIDRAGVAAAVAERAAGELETAVVDAGGCAAAMRTEAAWAAHDQGRAVAAEALVARSIERGRAVALSGSRQRPLEGVRILDLTRVIAGPVATRFLAAYGADVIRVDPVGFAEVPALLVEMTIGKRRTELDLRDPAGRAAFDELVRGADAIVCGYRPDALAGLGLGLEDLRARQPELIVVSLDAYGWTGPWRGRRGFDSLVQMSCGIAARGQTAAGADRPVPLPVQALDHATGYLAAAAVVRALADRRDGAVTDARLSLARTARWLVDLGSHAAPLGEPVVDADSVPYREPAGTAWGPVDRVRAPSGIAGTEPGWTIDAGPLGADRPHWQG